MAGRSAPGEVGALLLAPSTGAGSQNVAPSVSPDGRYVAFISERDLFSVDLFMADARTGRIIRRLSSAASDAHMDALRFLDSSVSWSPDGQRLAFARLHDETMQLVTMLTDGTGERVVRTIGDLDRQVLEATVRATGKFYPLLQVAWSPDSAHILYGCESQVCVVNLAGELVGRTPEEFANKQGRAAAAWAPDGSRIAVRAAPNPSSNGAVKLYTMAPDGSDVRVLVRGDGNGGLEPAAGADGEGRAP